MRYTPPVSVLPSQFITFPLPYKKAGTVYKKGFGNGSIALVSPIYVPYGLYGRYALLSLTNLACLAHSKAAVTVSGFSLYSLLSEYKTSHVSGVQLAMFETQFIAWAQTLITFSSVSAEKKSYKNLLLIDKSNFRLEKNADLLKEEVSVTFTHSGLEFLIENSVPMPLSAISEIESAFDFDVFCWLVISIFQTHGKDGIFAPWKQLEKQFGISSSNASRFRRNFSESLSAVRDGFYSQARYIESSEGIAIMQSPLLVRKKGDISIPAIGNHEVVV